MIILPLERKTLFPGACSLFPLDPLFWSGRNQTRQRKTPWEYFKNKKLQYDSVVEWSYQKIQMQSITRLGEKGSWSLWRWKIAKKCIFLDSVRLRRACSPAVSFKVYMYSHDLITNVNRPIYWQSLESVIKSSKKSKWVDLEIGSFVFGQTLTSVFMHIMIPTMLVKFVFEGKRLIMTRTIEKFLFCP